MRRRVAITGMGMVTPLGKNLSETWSALRNGSSGVALITRFDASTLPTRVAAEVKGFDLGDYLQDTQPFQHCGYNARFALAAASMAFENSGLDLERIDRERLGVYLGSGEGQPDFETFMLTLARAYNDRDLVVPIFNKEAIQEFHPQRETDQEPNMPSGHVASLFRAQGPNRNCLTACAASSQAIGEALEMIRRGEADMMIAGGAHSMIHPLGVAGFNLLTALSTRNDEPERASRPFDRDRDGFILGEGAGMIVMEELEHAKRRRANLCGELIGYGSTADAYRMTDAHPDGRGAIVALQEALLDAHLRPDEIQYVNAHGTSTGVGDLVETISMKAAFGDHAFRVPISSIKSMTGHLIAAAGSVELITCLLAIRDGIIPPTTNYDNPDPQCDLDFVPNEARPAKIDVALSNSFGFGGQNVCLVVRRFTR